MPVLTAIIPGFCSITPVLAAITRQINPVSRKVIAIHPAGNRDHPAGNRIQLGDKSSDLQFDDKKSLFPPALLSGTIKIIFGSELIKCSSFPYSGNITGNYPPGHPPASLKLLPFFRPYLLFCHFSTSGDLHG